MNAKHMKGLRILLLALLATAIGSMHARVKVKQMPLYIFGYALSPTDSTIYLTNIQRIDTAYLVKKTRMMIARPLYSQQLQQYLEQSNNIRGSICTIFFSEKKAKLEKKRNRVSMRAQKEVDYQICFLNSLNMTFTPVQWDESMSPELNEKPVKTKKAKKK